MHPFIFPDMGQKETENHVSGLIIQHYLQLRGLFNLLFFLFIQLYQNWLMRENGQTVVQAELICL